MFSKIIIHIKYPYAVGVLSIIWLGTLGYYVIDQNLPILAMVIVNSLVTLLIAKHAMN